VAGAEGWTRFTGVARSVGSSRHEVIEFPPQARQVWHLDLSRGVGLCMCTINECALCNVVRALCAFLKNFALLCFVAEFRLARVPVIRVTTVAAN
jgi:hypothetical protein